MTNSANSLTLDLSKKTPDEIAEFLAAILAARHTLKSKGFSMKISRRKAKPVLRLPR